MTIGHFIWTDLSTFDMALARKTYADLFGWSFDGDDSYDFAQDKTQAAAAVFPMPEFLVKINMPSFWMSYVHVEDLDARVEAARRHEGAIIEIEPQPFDEHSRIALVRDPSGAGFTMVEGSSLTPPEGPPQPGHAVRRYHHLPDIALIADFYKDLFGWTFHKTAEAPWPVYDIRHPDGSLVAVAEEVPEEIRGKFRYWMPCFAVGSLEQAAEKLSALGGEVTVDLQDGRLMAADPQGAAFMIRALEPEDSSGNRAAPGARLPWKAGLGLLCIWLAVVLDVPLFWGVLFLLWSWPALRTGRADFIEPVRRSTHPLLFWGLTGTWIGLSLWAIAGALGAL
ncbi:VOC family protein [Leisingera sp. ANG-DT]|uniref:VOC family protein n=1 Tax=Leisingera sp. ANG-DT TaxID=1577897 RepID=UPI00057D3DE1|nr:VOC family protein [Leisingera sp. ANG-DT]KIC17053.1 glyoxalase [Leisingera sp. ANG-DT]